MRILGIDPGLATLGWAVLEPGPRGPSYLQFGVLTTPAHQPLPRRLVKMDEQLTELFEREKPAVLAIEALFFLKNAKHIAQVGHTRGVVLLAAGRRNLDAHEYTPSQIKMALTGYGAADKRQMQSMVQRLLGLKEIPKPDDAADAVAVALCHAQFAPALRGAAAAAL